MSQLLGGATGSTDVLVRPDDTAHLAARWSRNDWLVVQSDVTGNPTYRTQWWPRQQLFGDAVADVGPFDTGASWWEAPDLTKGGKYRFGFSGITRDLYGSPLGGVTVKLFRASDDTKQDQIVSTAGGIYFVSSPFYPDAHYLVFYKAGFPDVFGTSVNTKIGA